MGYAWEDQGFDLWAVELKSSGDLIGFVRLSIPTFLPEVLPAVEVGWRLDRAPWGRGLATEGGRASLEYGFDTVGLDRIISIRHSANVASGRVIQKLGMRRIASTAHPVFGHELAIHEITQIEWRANRLTRGEPGST